MNVHFFGEGGRSEKAKILSLTSEGAPSDLSEASSQIFPLFRKTKNNQNEFFLCVL